MAEPIAEHDVVALTADLTEDGLLAGDVGTVVHVHGEGAAFEVEFPDPSGEQYYTVVTVRAGQLLRLRRMALRRLAG